MAKRSKPELYAEIAELKRELGKARAKAGKIFAPHYLKTIEVDTENKVFKVNGEDFGIGCSGFLIECTGYEEFSIEMRIDTAVRYAKYENCKKVSDIFRQPSQECRDQINDSPDDTAEC